MFMTVLIIITIKQPKCLAKHILVSLLHLYGAGCDMAIEELAVGED